MSIPRVIVVLFLGRRSSGSAFLAEFQMWNYMDWHGILLLSFGLGLAPLR